MCGRAYLGDTGRLEFAFPIVTDGGVSQVQFKIWLDWFTLADRDLDQIVVDALAASNASGKPPSR